MEIISRLKPKDCNSVVKLLDDFLSEELSVETNQQILQHLEVCPACRQEKGQREEARSLLKASWNAQPVPEHLESQIRSRLGGPPSRPQLWALAAGLALFLLGLAVLFPSYVSFDSSPAPERLVVDHYRHMVADHLNCRGVPARNLQLPLDSYEGRVEAAVQTFDPSFRLLEVQHCNQEEVQFVHYIFQGNRGRLSLILEPRQPNQFLPLRPGELQRVVAGVQVHALARQPVSVASLQSDRYFVYLVLDHSQPADSLNLAEKVLPSLKSVLFEG